MMTREEYVKLHKKCCDDMHATMLKKNADYTGGNPDPFFNFTRVEAVGIASTEQGFLTRMFDKFSRITTFVNKGVLQVSDESVKDTLLDLANYCLLMVGYIESRRMAEYSLKQPGTKLNDGSAGNPGISPLGYASSRSAPEFREGPGGGRFV